ncbi:uncharacterized protein LOC111027670 [Myzus persicae]|uniref:uncharacterized protein LOC111027670 n=1 Tax=Myzus persicae TaxID=13164 RepID=UPI000B936BDF|nr:uncharacterized protein LOC111027670 [Myzus persicae]
MGISMGFDDLQKKWKNVKDYYKKEKKELPSGSAAAKKKKNVYFEMLGFLDKTIERRSTISNVIEKESIIDNLQDVQHNIDNETIESDPLENEVLPKSTSQPRKQKMTDFQKSVVEVLAKRKISNDNEDLDEDNFLNQMPMHHQTPYISNTIPNIHQNITPANSSNHDPNCLFSPSPPDASNQSTSYIDVDF